MKKIDYTTINGQMLSTFLTVLDMSSVSQAAERLGVTQSTVSHTLSRLRTFFGDPLFVRSGQSLTPTERALSLKDPVRSIVWRGSRTIECSTLAQKRCSSSLRPTTCNAT